MGDRLNDAISYEQVGHARYGSEVASALSGAAARTVAGGRGA